MLECSMVLKLQDILTLIEMSSNKEYAISILNGTSDDYLNTLPKVGDDVLKLVSKQRSSYKTAVCTGVYPKTRKISFEGVCVSNSKYESIEDFKKRYSASVTVIDFSEDGLVAYIDNGNIEF